MTSLHCAIRCIFEHVFIGKVNEIIAYIPEASKLKQEGGKIWMISLCNQGTLTKAEFFFIISDIRSILNVIGDLKIVSLSC